MTVRFACAQIEVVPGRPDINFATIIDAIDRAKEENIDILILPELAIPGYFLGDLWESFGMDFVFLVFWVCVKGYEMV